MIRFLLMAASASFVVWVAAGAEPHDLRNAAERAALWVQELPQRAHFRSPLARRPELDAPSTAETPAPAAPVPSPAPEPAPPSRSPERAAPTPQEERLEIARAPLAEAPHLSGEPTRIQSAFSTSPRLSAEETERVRGRLDRVMTLVSGRAP